VVHTVQTTTSLDTWLPRGASPTDCQRREAVTETLDHVAEQALEEMAIHTGVGSFGQDFTTSIPCQLRFTEDTRQRTEKFHEALKVHDFHPLDTDPDRTASGREGGPDLPYYDGEVCHTDHYDRLHVLVFRGGAIRIFPMDNHIPKVEELACLLHAITIGWRSDVEHHPIDDTEGHDA